MVALRGMSRKAKFKAALVEARMTASAWARDVGGVSRTQLQRTLNNPEQSAPLTEKIDAFIAEHFDKPSALAS
jgi:hypothetical protein